MVMLMKNENRVLQKKIEELHNHQAVSQPILSLVSLVMNLQEDAIKDWSEIDIPEEFLADTDQHVQGVPLLYRSRFPVDLTRTGAFLDQLLEALKTFDGPTGSAMNTIRSALDDNELSLERAVEEFLRGEDEIFQTFAVKTPQAPRALMFLVQGSVTPGLVKTATRLHKRLSPNAPWMFGHCPICGSLPLIGRLKEREGFRFLTCSFCRIEYRVPRLSCPFCQEDRHDKLEYFSSDDEPGFIAETCLSCLRYIKTIDYRQFDRNCLPILDDLLSLPFDILARHRGFSRPTLSAWGF